MPKAANIGQDPDPVLQTAEGPLVDASIVLNFKGNSASGFAPPDTNAAIGATQIMQHVNVVHSIYDKATGKRLWFHEVFKNQVVLLERFDDLPCIVAAAQVVDDETKQYQYKVVVLDKQTGKLRYNKGHSQNGFFMSVIADPKSRAVEFFRYDLRLRIVPDDGETASQ